MVFILLMVLQSKYWVFTLNNYTDDELLRFRGKGDSPDISYLIFGIEEGASGTPHLQGYVEFQRKRRLAGVKKFFSCKRLHLEQRRGTSEEASDYCKKDGEYEEYGSLSQSHQGQRNDLEKIRDEIKDGVSERDIAEAYFSRWVVYRSSFTAYRQLIADNGIRLHLRVIVLHGEAGVGKSRYVWERYPDLYSCPTGNLQWFDGYEGQKTVLLDDYRGEADETFLLKLLDIYPMQVPVKGSFRHWVPDRIFITSNMHVPFGHYAIDAPLKRRIHLTKLLIEEFSFDDLDTEIAALNDPEEEAPQSSQESN